MIFDGARGRLRSLMVPEEGCVLNDTRGRLLSLMVPEKGCDL